MSHFSCISAVILEISRKLAEFSTFRLNSAYQYVNRHIMSSHPKISKNSAEGSSYNRANERSRKISHLPNSVRNWNQITIFSSFVYFRQHGP